MEVRVHLHSERRKKVALLVSKEPHCLQQLIDDFATGGCTGEIVGVFANHPDLEPLAEAAGLQFALEDSERPRSPFRLARQSLLETLGRPGRARPVHADPARSRSCRRFDTRSSTSIRRCFPISPGRRRTSRPTRAACASMAAPPISSPSNSTKAPSSCRTSSTSTSAPTRLEDVKRNGLELEARVLSKAVQLFLDEELVVVEGKVIFKPGISRFLMAAGVREKE